MLSLAGYLQSRYLPEHACPFQYSVGTALGCSLGLITLTQIEHTARIEEPAPCRGYRAPFSGPVPVLAHDAATPHTDIA